MVSLIFLMHFLIENYPLHYVTLSLQLTGTEQFQVYYMMRSVSQGYYQDYCLWLHTFEGGKLHIHPPDHTSVMHYHQFK